MELKVYEMNEYDWWADFSIEEAKTNYLQFTGLDEEDCKEDWEDGWPSELTEEDMNRLEYAPDPYEEPNALKRSFKEELQKRIEEGEIGSQFFASTEF